jgi:succinate-semialdehyde dehydrogenase/glutarate-semialdehyde dehydrogenase
MESVNPATGRAVRSYPELDARAAEQAADRARHAFEAFAREPIAVRCEALRRAALVLRQRRGELSRLITEEMGKPLASAESEIDKCASVCEFYADEAPRILSPEPVATEARESFVRFDPLGPVLAIMPWNFPFWQVFRFAAPALAAGNVGLLKHAANVPGCALAIADVFAAAGLPAATFTTLLVGSDVVPTLIRSDAVAAVTLTGSDRAGRSVAAEAGRHLKKVVLELGGSDPFIVLADADVERAASVAVDARILNAGQSCIAAKRFIVVEAVAGAFVEAMVERMRSVVVGDPMDRATELGPLARIDLVDTLEDQVRSTVGRGARLLTGGSRIDRPGFYFAPTVLGDVQPGMVAFDDETFGPVAAVCPVRDAADAVRLANATRFGLGAAIWTRDHDLARSLAAELQAGMVFVNAQVKSDARMPFGGVKQSGHGRELSRFGLLEFVNVKTVWID